MKPKQVLIVYKKSTYQLQAIEYKDPRFLKLLADGHPSISKVVGAHQQHEATLQAIEDELKSQEIAFDTCHRADLAEKAGKCDLLITVGGDGTFLDASHFLRKVPILGVNSAPGTSFGHFSLANKDNFSQVFRAIVSGQTPPQNLLRLELTLGHKILPELVLNEVLLAHSNPAGTSRYTIKIDGKEEEQRSSGLWIGPPAGSTGALKSAGAKVLEITSSEYQFVVREAWTKPGQEYIFCKGSLSRGQNMTIISQMRTGALYIDGQHIEYPFPLGEELTVKAAEDDLIAFVNPRVNDIFAV